MFNEKSLSDWENLVQKQLKTDDIYGILSAENLEGVVVKPYSDTIHKSIPNLPRAEESTHLVSRYRKDLEDDVLAFLLTENVENLVGKTIFVDNKDLAEHIAVEEENRYISLIDIYSEEQDGGINEQLGQELLAKNFERNICVDVALHQNAGASINQQLAFALAKAKDLSEIFGAEIFSKLTFRFGVGANYFFEIAKIRAFKILYNQLSKEFGLNEIPFIFAETSWRNKSIHDHENNLIRSTLELSAAMIGGADAVFSNDFRLNDGDVLSEEISFKQQIVLAYESIINVFDDAGNGSYYIEDITRQFAEQSWKLFLEIEEKGGYAANIRSQNIQLIIYEQALREQTWVESGKIKLVGVNLYPAREKTKSIDEMYDRTSIKPVRWAEMFE